MKEEFQETYGQITELIAAAKNLTAAADWQGAMAKLNQAWDLLPDPKNRWGSSTRVLAAIGELCIHSGHYQSGLEALRFAMVCPDGTGNPLLHLRLGQFAFERQYMEEAADHLGRAHALDSTKLSALGDPRYAQFMQGRGRQVAADEA